ncbi:MAG: potassium channel family protein [Polyangiaceae bacterium]
MMFQILRTFFARMKDPPGAIRVLVLLAGLICYGTTGFLFFELPQNPDLQWSDGLWWTLATLTTVGYGDISPATMGGRYAVAAPMMLVGIGLLGYILSLAAASLVEARSRDISGLSTMKMSGHVVVINYPNEEKVHRLLDELAHGGLGTDVVLVDEDLAEIPPALLKRGVRYVRGNPSRDETLSRAAIDDSALALVLCKRPGDPHSDDLNLAITLAIEGRAPDVRTVAECIDPAHEELFRKAGCDSIVCTSRFDAHFLGSEALNPGAQDVVDELMSVARGQRFCFTRVEAKGETSFGELSALCAAEGHIPIGVRRGRKVELNVSARAKVSAGDELITIGSTPLDPIRA